MGLGGRTELRTGRAERSHALTPGPRVSPHACLQDTVHRFRGTWGPGEGPSVVLGSWGPLGPRLCRVSGQCPRSFSHFPSAGSPRLGGARLRRGGERLRGQGPRVVGVRPRRACPTPASRSPGAVAFPGRPNHLASGLRQLASPRRAAIPPSPETPTHPPSPSFCLELEPPHGLFPLLWHLLPFSGDALPSLVPPQPGQWGLQGAGCVAGGS